MENNLTLNKEMWKKIREVEIKTSKVVSDLFSGDYKSTFKGKGLDFKEFKEYEQGDDPKYIDWKVSAKTGSIHVKKFSEERELTLIIALDVSNSTLFGSNIQLKRELAIEFTASIAFSGMKNNDKVGLILFSDHIVEFIPPKKGRNHVIRILKTIISYTYKKDSAKYTDINKPLKLINKLFNKKVIIFFVSDFLADGFEKEIKITSYKHDLIGVIINDSREYNIPAVGLIEMQDNETNERYLLDTSDKKIMLALKDNLNKKYEVRDNIFIKNRIDKITLTTDQSYIIPLNNFFKRREKRV
ncbi:MAG: DUF58 domain-containing protein [Candidatus Sericytochromatia bacterium]|nr:DUF58 domain-containing protein [Candidatus Sericytochromatia bacterium]